MSPTSEQILKSQDRQAHPVSNGPARPPAYPFLCPPLDRDEIGRLGNYRVLALLGSGGTSIIFRAEDVELRRPVALKVLKPHLSQDVEGWKRFQREARIMASIKHEHLVTIYQVGRQEDTAFLAMELLEGDSLDRWITRLRVPPIEEVLRVAREIVSGLVLVHSHGIVHRDIKPANIWVCSPRGNIKILDFGLASCFQDDANLTRTGTVMGTPAFMSPEQARGEKVDAQSDLFSLGCVLYCLCTGKKPFRDDNTMAMLRSLALDDPRPVADLIPEIPGALSDLIMQLLAKVPAQRPNSAKEILERLHQIESGTCVVRPVVQSLLVPKVVRASGGSPGRLAHRHKSTTLAVTTLLVFLAVFGLGQFGRGLLGPIAVALSDDPIALADDSEIFSQEGVQPGDWDQWPFPQARYSKLSGGKWLPPGAQIIAETSGAVFVKGRITHHGSSMEPALQPLDIDPTNQSCCLNKQYGTFRADVSIKSEREPSGVPIFFRVFGDDKRLWESKALTPKTGLQSCNLSVKGVDVLRFDVHYPAPVRGKHAVCIDASVSP
jgi:serine/threonine protein kinase